MSADEIVIVAARRTPMGSFLGQFAEVAAPALGASAIAAAVADSGVAAADIDELFMGCVLPAGIGQAPARQAALLAGLPDALPCTTVNKVCGSGMQAVILACHTIRAGAAEVVLAGGMESMSRAPYLLTRMRQGLRMGHGDLIDHMFYDGLQNAADGKPMGWFAECCADRYGFSRAQQDAYAAESVRRALAACRNGAFAGELAAVPAEGQTLDQDETPQRCDPERIPKLRPAFRKPDGTVTAASSASIADGAAALILMRGETARARGIAPLASIIAHARHARAPEEFTIAPIHAIKSLYEKTGWQDRDVDLYEINEAFAAVVLAAIKELGLDHTRININGGACALGHPIGATGARIIVSLVHALKNRGLQRGIAALCIGGGEATAVAIECGDTSGE